MKVVVHSHPNSALPPIRDYVSTKKFISTWSFPGYLGYIPTGEDVINGKCTDKFILHNRDAYECYIPSSRELEQFLIREQERNADKKLLTVQFKSGKTNVRFQNPKHQTIAESKDTTITVPKETSKRKIDTSWSTEDIKYATDPHTISNQHHGVIRGSDVIVTTEEYYSTIPEENISTVPPVQGQIDGLNSTGRAIINSGFELQLNGQNEINKTNTPNHYELFMLRGQDVNSWPTEGDWVDTVYPTHIWELDECTKLKKQNEEDFTFSTTFKPYWRSKTQCKPNPCSVKAFKLPGRPIDDVYYFDNFMSLLSDSKMCFDKVVYLFENHNRQFYDFPPETKNPQIPKEEATSYRIQTEITLELVYRDL